MSLLWFSTPSTRVEHVDVNEKTFTLQHETLGEEEKMTLPKSALAAMIIHYDDIMLDLEDINKPVKKYWSDIDTVIYTKEVHIGIFIPRKDIEKRKVLCITQPPLDFALDVVYFQTVILKAVVQNRIQKDDCILSRVGPQYNLNSTKNIIFHNSNSFSIVDDDAPNQFEMKIFSLIELLTQRRDILADLDHTNISRVSEWNIPEVNNLIAFRTWGFENSRAFFFSIGGSLENYEEDEMEVLISSEEHIVLKKHTFDLLLHVVLGAPMWRNGMVEDEKINEPRMIHWDSTPYNTVTRIDFSVDLQKFTINNESYGVTLTLPTAALKAMLDRKLQVLSDLESETIAASRRKAFVNEYWTDQTYAIRTGALYNLFREFACNVVKFLKVKNDETVFVVHKAAFLRILESYKNRRRNSKRR